MLPVAAASPASRRGHTKSQSTSAMSTILSPPFRTSQPLPPLPSFPLSYGKENIRRSRSRLAEEIIPDDGDVFGSPAISSRSSRAVKDGYGRETSSLRRDVDIEQSKETPGSPTPKKSRRTETPGSPRSSRRSQLKQPGLSASSSLSSLSALTPKESCHRQRVASGSSVSTGPPGTPRKTESRTEASTRAESNQANEIKILRSHRSKPEERLESLRLLWDQLLRILPRSVKSNDLVSTAFFNKELFDTLSDILARHSALLPYLEGSKLKQLEEETRIILILLQGGCLLNPTIWGQGMTKRWILEVTIDLLKRFTVTPDSPITEALAFLHYSHLNVDAPDHRITARFMKCGGFDALEALVLKGRENLASQLAYEAAELMMSRLELGGEGKGGRMVSTSTTRSETESLDSMTTGSTGSSGTTAERDRLMMITPITMGSSVASVEAVPRTPKRSRDEQRRIPATTHGAVNNIRDLPSSSGFYTPQARGEKRRGDERATGTPTLKALGRVVEEEVASESPKKSPMAGLPIRLAPGSPIIEDFGTDLDGTMHSTIRLRRSSRQDNYLQPMETSSPRKGIAKSRSTMGPELVMRSSGKPGIGKGLPSSPSSGRLSSAAPSTPSRRTSGPLFTSYRSISGSSGASSIVRGEPARSGSRLKKSSTSMGLSSELEGE